ncbi:MAG TPA: agmatinase [Geminicoccaceae bacterium]|nr:agmatinase [Geminicoccaceae bacterium]
MVDSIINCADPAVADAVLVGAPYQRGASFGSGAAGGPQAIVACLDRQIELLERHTRTEPAYRYRIAHQMLDGIDGLAPEDMVASVAEAVSRHEAFTVVLGGTHAVSIGALRAHAMRDRAADVTLLQIDAHLDMRDDDSDYNDRDPSRFAHSCVMRRAREMGFCTCSVGTRAYAREEYRYAVDQGLPMFEWGRGPEPAIEEILAAIGTERVYLSVDVDGFDPAVAPATGTPVPGGLSWAYGTRLVREVFRTRDVIGADIVEVAPLPGSVLTEYAAAQLCYDLLSYKLLKRDGELVFV